MFTGLKILRDYLEELEDKGMKRKYTGLKKATAVPTMPPAQTPNPIAKLSKIKAEKSIDIFGCNN